MAWTPNKIMQGGSSEGDLVQPCSRSMLLRRVILLFSSQSICRQRGVITFSQTSTGTLKTDCAFWCCVPAEYVSLPQRTQPSNWDSWEIQGIYVSPQSPNLDTKALAALQNQIRNLQTCNSSQDIKPAVGTNEQLGASSHYSNTLGQKVAINRIFLRYRSWLKMVMTDFT